jgi:uncharacterized membrane protein
VTAPGPVVPAPVPRAGVPGAPARGRLDSVDLLRGAVMVLMALDHVRDYFSIAHFDPTDLSRTTPALFLTRWVTHFCAPVFVFLAGTGAYLSAARGRSRSELSRFLLTRGLWLVVLEFTVVRFGWIFNADYRNLLFVQVIWVLGVSMVVLAGLVHLPRAAVVAFGAVMVLGHNLLDGVQPDALGEWGTLWTVLHVQAPVTVAGLVILVAYPLVPWVGVMALGYGFGPLLLRPPAERRRLLLRLGAALTVAFLVLRATNLYGDPRPWAPQGSATYTLLSYLNVTKYPPSLLFLLVTLGPAIAALPLLERVRGPVARFFVVYGRVPLLYYVAHLYLIHALAVAVGVARGFDFTAMLGVWMTLPDTWGFGLPVVYLVWVAVVLALYPLCRWFANLKAHRREAWLSYL